MACVCDELQGATTQPTVVSARAGAAEIRIDRE